VVYVSATPAEYELGISKQIVEQVIRPTGLVDPEIEVKPTENQVDDLIEQIRQRVSKGQRVLVTTLTKKLAERLANYLGELNIKVAYPIPVKNDSDFYFNYVKELKEYKHKIYK
jgi:excinuclease ABC subunit B